MTLKVAFQMDDIAHLDIRGDSTFAMMLEAQARGHEIYTYLPDQLSYDSGELIAIGSRAEVRDVPGDHFSLDDPEHLQLRDFDTVMLRQDPPFDMNYMTTTYLLELIHPETLVVNNPVEVRNAPEKLFLLNYPELTAPTLITRCPQAVDEFREKFKDIIVKPLYGNGGAGIFWIKEDDTNLSSLIEMLTTQSREPFIVQQYLPAVREGDKRVILVDGEPVGAINRVPAAGETRSNMHVGGRPEKIEMSARDLEICEAIGPLLKEKGQVFVGIDVIGNWLTEINVTSPTGIQELERFDGINVAEKIWEAIENRRA